MSKKPNWSCYLKIREKKAVSFVHAYQDDDYKIDTENLPALWIHEYDQQRIINYPFPRNLTDFEKYKDYIYGNMPLLGAENFKTLPRFGLTGLSQTKQFLYAGSWNAVYEIKKTDYSLNRIISNSMMNDCHGIWVEEDLIITVLTGKDTIVISNHDGLVVDHFTVSNDLSFYKHKELENIDWRFLSKQFRGATGLWHFNYVQKFGNEIWLTSRNLNSFLVFDLKSRKSWIRTMNHKTVSLLHDGVFYKNEFFFTSIDGKIIISADAATANFFTREETDEIWRFTRDMVCEVIRLEDTELGKQPNWCRGIACKDDEMFITIDGRYGSELSFGLLGLKRNGKKTFEKRLYWSDIGAKNDLRYVTGFDVTCF